MDTAQSRQGVLFPPTPQDRYPPHVRILARTHTAHQIVVVRGNTYERQLEVQGALHAWWHRDRFLALAWGPMAAAALLHPKLTPRRILMLGLAGGTAFRILRHLLPQAQLTAVEIDPVIIRLARRFMHLDSLSLELHLNNASHWLAHNRQQFDVVIDDCYLAGKTDVFRPLALNPAFLHHLQRAVAPNGLLAINLVTGPGHRTLQSAFRTWFRTAFPVTCSLTAPDSQNETLVGARHLLAPRTLRRWTHQFTHPLDRRRWDQIRVRRLSPASRSR
jgi:spermidine synthase